jgi:hypothetical protein
MISIGATRSKPSLVLARTLMGWMNVFLGDGDAAVTQLEVAMRVDPLDPRNYAALAGMAYAHFFTGRNEDASVRAAAAVRQRPKFVPAQRIFHAVAGRPDHRLNLLGCDFSRLAIADGFLQLNWMTNDADRDRLGGCKF